MTRVVGITVISGGMFWQVIEAHGDGDVVELHVHSDASQLSRWAREGHLPGVAPPEPGSTLWSFKVQEMNIKHGHVLPKWFTGTAKVELREDAHSPSFAITQDDITAV